MESNERYYARRAIEELRALDRAVTPEARARRLALARAFQARALGCGGNIGPSESSRREPDRFSLPA
jgi:hypothetical protein